MSYDTKPIVIGKIPGYNDYINRKRTPDSGEPIDYTERLKNNLTTVAMRPTGYTINFKTVGFAPLAAIKSAADLVTTDNKIDGYFGDTIVKEASANTSLYQIGPEHSLGASLNYNDLTGNTTKNALDYWNSLVQSNMELLAEKDSEVNELRILCTNDSTMTEVFGNVFGESSAESMINSAASVLSPVAALKKGVTVDSSMGLNMLDIGNSSLKNNQVLNIIAGKALGIQSSLPKEWKNSDYNNSLQLMVKLVSPSGDDKSIKEYILKPLMYLIMATAPVTYDGVNYGYPTLWEVQAEGMMDIKLAAITAMTITRGGNETQFNRFNQPLNVDVRFTVEPLIKGFSASMTQTDYKDFLVANPAMLRDSFSIEEINGVKTAKYQTINL